MSSTNANAKTREDLDRAPRLLDVEAVAEMLGVSASLVYRLHARGEGPPAARLGSKLLRWRVADINAWLDAQVNGKPSPAPKARRRRA